ncbi:MAG: glycosyltransferase family 4 protein [Desulfobaccales bacterium]
MATLFFVSSIYVNLYHFRRGLMQALLARGNEVVALAAPDGYEEGVREMGVVCRPLRHIRRGGLNPLEEGRFFLELLRSYRSGRPDVVLHYTIKPVIYGSLAAAAAGIPSFCTVTGGGYALMNKGPLYHLTCLLYRLALLFPRAVFFQNPDDQEFFLSRRLVSFSKVRRVPGSGVDLGHYSPQPSGTPPREDRPIFLFIGRLLWDKGIGEFAAAAGRVKSIYPHAEFQVLGALDPGNPAVVPERQVRTWEWQGEIRWLRETRDVRPFIAQADVVVLPSYREGMPRSVLEAMAMGKPVITTDAVGCREVIEDGKNGFMVPVRDANALAAAMVKMIEIGPEARREMGRYGRLKAEREFDERIVIQRYVEEIERLLAEKPRA